MNMNKVDIVVFDESHLLKIKDDLNNSNKSDDACRISSDPEDGVINNEEIEVI